MGHLGCGCGCCRLGRRLRRFLCRTPALAARLAGPARHAIAIGIALAHQPRDSRVNHGSLPPGKSVQAQSSELRFPKLRVRVSDFTGMATPGCRLTSFSGQVSVMISRTSWEEPAQGYVSSERGAGLLKLGVAVSSTSTASFAVFHPRSSLLNLTRPRITSPTVHVRG